MPPPSMAGLVRRTVVGVAELVASNNPQLVLATYSLGSCLGISVYDPTTRVGGLIHVMLPVSTIDPSKAVLKPAMFIDSGLPALFRATQQLGGDKRRLRICVAGGAQILDNSSFFNIGRRNREALAELLQDHGLTVVAEQVGGLVSRSMCLSLANGEVRLKVSGQPQETVLCKS